MHYKTQSTITISILMVVMVIVGVLINMINGTITGATVYPVCKCSSDADCDDDNECTEDICLYADDCISSVCINKKIEGCKIKPLDQFLEIP